MKASEHIPSKSVDLKPKDSPEEVVENFRRDIETWFVRFQTFYDRSNVEMRNYRMAHVALITTIYNEMMQVMGEDIQAIVDLNTELTDLIELKAWELGGINACLQGIIDTQNVSLVRSSNMIGACALSANQTMEANLVELFYPTFAGIQSELSTLPNAVIDILSRGNALSDERLIINFLEARYRAYELRWFGDVSQLLRWETARFNAEGLFLADDMTLCMAQAVIDFLISVAPLHNQIRAC